MYLRTVAKNVTEGISGRLTTVKCDIKPSGNHLMDLMTNVLDYAEVNYFATLLLCTLQTLWDVVYSDDTRCSLQFCPARTALSNGTKTLLSELRRKFDRVKILTHIPTVSPSCTPVSTTQW
jgi:hypothetical protein